MESIERYGHKAVRVASISGVEFIPSHEERPPSYGGAFGEPEAEARKMVQVPPRLVVHLQGTCIVFLGEDAEFVRKSLMKHGFFG